MVLKFDQQKSFLKAATEMCKVSKETRYVTGLARIGIVCQDAARLALPFRIIAGGRNTGKQPLCAGVLQK